MKILLESVKDAELDELHRMSHLMSPETSQLTLVKEKRAVPTSDTILGSLVNRIPEQKLPDKETCALISTIFLDLAEAHKHYANTARGIADIAGLISPEQLTLVLAAAVPPTLQLVLPPGQISPLSAPLPSPMTATTAAGRQEMIKYYKNMILPDPSADAFKGCKECTPTRVLAAAIFCVLEKHLFDETTSRPTLQPTHLKDVRNVHLPVYLPLPSFVSLKSIYLMKQHPEQRLLQVSALQLLSSTRLSPV